METIKFDREKIAAMQIFSDDIIADMDLRIGKCCDQFVTQETTAILSAYFYSNKKEERIMSYTFKRPTFFEWLFRKKRTAKFNVVVKDLLINPPNKPACSRIVTVEKLTNNI